MVLLYIFLAVVIGYIFLESPFLGFFFYAILMWSSRVNRFSLKFLSFLSIVIIVVILLINQLDVTLEEKRIDYLHIIDYKYYKDSIHYIVENNNETYELYIEEGLDIIPLGSKCTGSFNTSIPEEQRNFVKKDSRTSLILNELSGRIYLDNLSGVECKEADLNLKTKINQIRFIYMSKVLNITEYDYKFDMLTLAVGNKSYITSEFFDALQKLGIYHLYVISGTHVAFLSAFIYGALKMIRTPVHYIKIILIIVLLCFFLINFFSPSVLRAVFMGVCLLVCSFFDKKPYMTIISLSALVQVLINPSVMYHAGFQLSYVTTYFILLTRPLFMQFSSIGQLVIITVICELSTIVIVLLHFNEISLSGLILNIIFVPFFSFIIFPSVLIFNFLSFIHLPVFMDEIYNFTFSCIKRLIDFLSHSFKHRMPIKNLHPLSTLVLFILSYGLIIFTLKKSYFKIFTATVMMTIVLYTNHQNFTQNYTLTMVDVGQGDAFIIEDYRANKTILIDTGGQFLHNKQVIPLSEKTVLPYLKEQGIDKLDLIVVSHLDIDHSGELLNILSKIDSTNILMNTNDEKFEEWSSSIPKEYLSKIIDSRNIEDFMVGTIYIQHLYSMDVLDDSNNQSVVLKVTLDQFKVLFTGDIGIEREADLVGKYNLESDILKVGHHGSDTSSSLDFIEAVEPDIALISAGVNNRYGHPHNSVIENLEGIRTYLTADSGMVKFGIKDGTICTHEKLTQRQSCLQKDIKKEPVNGSK
ncbi:DNA internalization-related competence protein ComEC/Rec2 [Jeotgalicoccus sp. S0W5]|uniref:DNA internalization-related competence protein ComEC/Rec2 n=1 Tax=Jeotgalicoccus sp. S0W5 TaxID=2527874 RepID=UPI001414E766|nr:DNA internalization-related competence protein ComEC/Rec2 [Jeotgalicoccus sp. S0W5]